MLHIESYIIRTKKFSIRDINNIDEDLFVDVKNIQSLDASALDYDYLHGAICIVYKDKVVLGFKHWDLVDQLWYYFIDALIQLKSDSKSEFTFPDQPLLVSIEKKGLDYLTIRIQDSIVHVPSMDFIASMYESAKTFFDCLLLLFPEKSSDIQISIDQVAALKEAYNL